MSKKARKREVSSGTNSSICLKIEHCTLSWRGGGKCSKNRCRNYVDPKNAKYKKK